MLTKEKIISGIQKLPDSVTIDDILDHILFMEKIEKGLQQLDNGQIITDEELDIRLAKWLE
jgi:hypothetical protein